MDFTATQIAEFLEGDIEGNSEVKVNNVTKIEEGKPGTISFLANLKYSKYIYTTKSSIVLVNKTFKAENTIAATLIRVEDAYQSFASLLDLYVQQIEVKKGIENLSFIDDTATLGKDIYVGAFAYIGKNVKLGDNVKIYPHAYVGDNVVIGNNTTINSGVNIYRDCKIGSNCTIHSGAIIGADGFGFAPKAHDDYKKIQQIGNVVLEDNVEVGSNTTIDRATMGSTIIKHGVKLDNLIQVGHNVVIGEHTVIAAQSGVSGSTKIGRDCMIGGQVGLSGHLTIGNEVKIGAQAGIGSSIKDGEILLGTPAFNIRDFQRSYVYFRKLPQLNNKIADLEKQIAELKAGK
ncbi:MAG: UDP-3-O-(3-hydroxymyristoyl)glucosamine N-acyltransferase [Bacteroidetes bacterium]|nr:UDP-3-O-(3-hydroxymyristoyl)glucosamine N-acyltransferase [Bacteroidota bacterium]